MSVDPYAGGVPVDVASRVLSAVTAFAGDESLPVSALGEQLDALIVAATALRAITHGAPVPHVTTEDQIRAARDVFRRAQAAAADALEEAQSGRWSQAVLDETVAGYEAIRRAHNMTCSEAGS